MIELHDLKKEFDGTPVLRGISLDIKSREFVTLLGPSGCGKTTTLRIIGGFEQPDSGDVLFEGRRSKRRVRPTAARSTPFSSATLCSPI